MTAPALAGGGARRAIRRTVDTVAQRPWLLTLAVGVVEIALGLHGQDSPAADFRTWLFRKHGLVLVTPNWYGGDLTLGYSVIAPILSAVLGVRGLSLLSCIASTRAMTRLVRGWLPGRHALGLSWFAVAVTVDLAVGRDAFALGLAFALTGLAAAQRGSRVWAGVCAVLCSLASPLAAAFLLLAAAAWLPRGGWRQVAPLGGAASGLAIAFLLGERGGLFPFPVSTLLISLLATAIGLAVTPRRHRTLRLAMLGYIPVALLLFVVPNPVGGNITRAFALLAGPMAAVVLWSQHRRRLLTLLGVPLLLWQFSPLATAVADGRDPSSKPVFYTALLAELRTQPGPLRLEIPFTRDHWEAAFVAPTVPLARGWERQDDIALNPVLYSEHLTDAAYLRWLRDDGVTDVALPDVPLDSSARQEGALLLRGVPGLVEIWHDRNWVLWRVTRTHPLVSGGRLIDLAATRFTVQVPADRVVRVLVHWADVWEITQGTGCLGETAGKWIALESPTAGRVTVSAHLLGGHRDDATCQALDRALG
jgi:hypothetical protein